LLDMVGLENRLSELLQVKVGTQINAGRPLVTMRYC
jgi:hypothetical protein